MLIRVRTKDVKQGCVEKTGISLEIMSGFSLSIRVLLVLDRGPRDYGKYYHVHFTVRLYNLLG